MHTVNLTHVNSKEILSIIPEQIFYVSYSPAHKASMVVSPAGAYCLVAETREQILNLRQEALVHNNRAGMEPAATEPPNQIEENKNGNAGN